MITELEFYVIMVLWAIVVVIITILKSRKYAPPKPFKKNLKMTDEIRIKELSDRAEKLLKEVTAMKRQMAELEKVRKESQKQLKEFVRKKREFDAIFKKNGSD